MLQQSSPIEVKQKRKMWKLNAKKISQQFEMQYVLSIVVFAFFNAYIPHCESMALVGFLESFFFKA